MHRRRIISVSALTAIGLVLSLSGALAQTKSLKDQIVGTWTVVSDDATPKSKGILILHAGGRYAIVQANPDRPKIKDPRNRSIGMTTGVAPTPCPLLEGYPDCH